MDLTALARQLGETIGTTHVIDDPEQSQAYALQGHTPDLVVAPGSVAELAQAITAAAQAQAVVTPWGGGTHQAQGSLLDVGGENQQRRPWVVVRTTRLNKVIEHEPADLTIVVEAGMTPAELDAAIRPHGQMLPIDAPLSKRTTLGGMIATAADGPRRLGYGLLRDLLLGVTVVEPSGRVSKAGGSVVKNVSGYDMMKIYLGSYGTLATVALTSFKLIPRARAAATIWCAFDTPAAAFAFGEALHASQLWPMAVEYVAGAESMPSPCGVAVLTEGLAAAVERHERDVPQLANETGVSDIRLLHDDEHEQLWQRIADLPQTADLHDDEMLLRLTCLPSDLRRAMHAASDSAERHSLTLITDARLLSGVAYLRVRGGDQSTLQAFHRDLHADWPALVVLACNDELKAALPVWGREPAGIDLMRRIKHEFDPQLVMNPGRFVV